MLGEGFTAFRSIATESLHKWRGQVRRRLHRHHTLNLSFCGSLSFGPCRFEICLEQWHGTPLNGTTTTLLDVDDSDLARSHCFWDR